MARSPDIVQSLVEIFEAHASPDDALPMKRYMRDRFEFLGIRTPLRRTLVRAYMVTRREEVTDNLRPLVIDLWQQPYREFQYAAIDLLERRVKALAVTDLPLLESLIIQKSWWDTVDALATRVAGPLLHRSPEAVPSTLSRWRASDDLWLRRTAILFQLKYREETDETLLFQVIRENAASDEFFILKAIGSALREYSKTRPVSVREFVNRENLAPLSRREALKWLKSHAE